MADSKYPNGIRMPSIDNLFTTEDERQTEKQEKVQVLPLSELHPFDGHPFEVRDDEEMDKMVDSVKEYGVMTPAIVRPREGGGYEIVSGHRRSHAAARAGLQEVPAIVREMDYDTAIILMVDSNVQREHVLPMEKARAFQMKLEALKRQGERTDLTSDQLGRKLESAGIIGEQAGESKTQVRRYIRLNNLIPELQQMVNAQELKMNPAVELSYLKPEEQKDFFDYIDAQSVTPTLSQAQKLKSASRQGELDGDRLEDVMLAKPPKEEQITLSVKRLSRYFPRGYTIAQMEHQIIHMLQDYFHQMQRENQQDLER